MIPDFDMNGVLPPGRYLATVLEIEHRFVATFPTSLTRRPIFQGWHRRREELFSLVEVECEWVDGSFVTSKREPGDLDVVAFVSATEIAALTFADRARVVGLTHGAYPQIAFGCHSFLTVVVDESQPAEHHNYLMTRGYWDRWWSRDRSVAPKGYLEVRGPA